MIEYAAFGFMTLKWWTWLVLWAVVLFSVYSAQRLSAWRDARLEARQERGPEPCLAHMGADADQFEHWCWKRYGHDGPHMNCWGVPQGDFDRDEEAPGPDEELRLPDGVSDVPIVLANKGPELCSYGEDGDGNESACWKWAGHDGPHMVQDHFTGDQFER